MTQVRRARNFARKRRWLTAALLALAVGLVGAAVAAGASGSSKSPSSAANSLRAVTSAVDSCGYPNGTGRTATTFNESTVLEGFSATALGTSTATVQLFYSDEWELNLGAAPIEQWDPTYASFTSTIFADDAGTNPNSIGTGSTGNGGAQPIVGGGYDPQGRPDDPEIFVTDITGTNHTASTPEAGDWQKQGTGTDPKNGAKPNFVGGTWKVNGQAVHNVVGGKAQANGTAGTPGLATNDKKPWLGPHADAFDHSLNATTEGYAAEARWDVSTLHDYLGVAVKPGHTYKVQMMIHDGDHVSDTGEACRLVTIPKAPSTTVTSPNVKITEDINLTIDTSTNANASVHAGDTVDVKLFRANPTPGGTTTGCTATNQNGGTGAEQMGTTNTIVIDPTPGTGNYDPTTGTLSVTLSYPDDFGGPNNGDPLTNGKYWWFVQYSGNDEVDGSNDDCTETFALSASLLPPAP